MVGFDSKTNPVDPLTIPFGIEKWPRTRCVHSIGRGELQQMKIAARYPALQRREIAQAQGCDRLGVEGIQGRLMARPIAEGQILA